MANLRQEGGCVIPHAVVTRICRVEERGNSRADAGGDDSIFAELREFHKPFDLSMNEVICSAFRIGRADRHGMYLSTVNGIQPMRDAYTGSGEEESQTKTI